MGNVVVPEHLVNELYLWLEADREILGHGNQSTGLLVYELFYHQYYNNLVNK